MPGSYQVTVVGIPTESYLKSARLGGQDVLNDGLNLDRDPENPLEIVVSSHAGRIDGNVLDKDGRTVQMAAVTLLPRDRDRHDLYHMTDTDGRGIFNFQGLAPGEYKLFAWIEFERGAQFDPDFMLKYEDLGTVVRITEASAEKVVLRVREP